MRLRQVVLAAADLAQTRTRIEDELGLPHVWADPGVGVFGLRNALYAIADALAGPPRPPITIAGVELTVADPTATSSER